MSELLTKLKERPEKFTLEDKQALILEYTSLIRFIAQRIASKLPPNIYLDYLRQDMYPSSAKIHHVCIKKVVFLQ